MSLSELFDGEGLDRYLGLYAFDVFLEGELGQNQFMHPSLFISRGKSRDGLNLAWSEESQDQPFR